ncbi:HTH domain-containing protein [Weissella confusa]|uniref:HTH domain-containing protein n=1 Tax=Weissella confusa TaxID=1583 RepID=UPI001081E12D|nr:HTH domain-containing protein [Weissella confusa]MBJ7654333.1 HTH domain-containing protein [Weissella confusa]TGE40287.1 RepB-like protein [Weissella confusa]
MSENLKTIRELADELGVSKQAIWQKIKRDASIDLRQFTSTKGNTVYVNVDGQKIIKSMFKNDSSTKERQHKDDVDDNEKDDVDTQNEVKFLRNLVSEIQSEKKELHKLLDQQQRLALQDKKLLEEYKSEIKELKSLTMSKRGSEGDDFIQKENAVENRVKEGQNKNKKWWHFGK